MDQSTYISVNHDVQNSRFVIGSVPPLAGSEWDRLLSGLGLTDIEAVTAVREGTEAGQLVTRFVRKEFRQHFIPEDVLHAVKMHWEVARQVLLDLRVAQHSPGA